MQEILELTEQPVTTSEMVLVSQKINNGLIAFQNKKDELTALAEEAKGLKITSIEDKESIKLVSEKRKQLKAERVQIEKDGKAMRDNLTKINREISSKENELIEIIEPVEKDLLKEENWLKEEKEKIRLEEVAKEEARIQIRINALAQYGFEIDYSDIKSMSDETFEKYVDAAKVQYDKEQIRIAEEKRIEEENKIQAEKDRKELEELRAQKARDDKKRADDEAALKAQIEKLRQEKIKYRCDRLVNLGLTEGLFSYSYKFLKECTISKDTVENLSDEGFADTISGLETNIKVAIEAEEIQRQKEIDDAAEAKRLKGIEDAENLRKLEAEKLAQSSDKVKFKTVIDQLKAITIPEMKSRKALKLSAEVNGLILKIVDHINQNI